MGKSDPDLRHCRRWFGACATDSIAFGSRGSDLVAGIKTRRVDSQQFGDVLGRLHARGADGGLKQLPDDDVRKVVPSVQNLQELLQNLTQSEEGRKYSQSSR